MGLRFTRLIVLNATSKRAPNGAIIWKCRCDCGKTINVESGNLLRGVTKSCHCLGIEIRKIACGNATRTHGLSLSSTYKSWYNMLTRCTNPNTAKFKYYGGKGITVCDKWFKFTEFLADMGEKPRQGYSIDRIDSTKGYFKDNCQWLLQEDNARKQSNNRNSITGRFE